MKFVILSTNIIPVFNVRGPVLSPAEYDIQLVLRWIRLGVDVREVMEDGSYRKLKHDDEKLMELLNKDCDKNKENKSEKVVPKNIKPQGNVRIKEENRPIKKPNNVKKDEPKKEEKKPKDEVKEKQVNQDLIIDNLEKPE
jgi:hypothetical protein